MRGRRTRAPLPDLPKPLKNLSKTLYNSPSTLWNLLELPNSPTTSQKPPKTSPGLLPDCNFPEHRTSKNQYFCSPDLYKSIFSVPGPLKINIFSPGTSKTQYFRSPDFYKSISYLPGPLKINLLLCYFVTMLLARWRGRSSAALWIKYNIDNRL